jgi:hypothetical protein
MVRDIIKPLVLMTVTVTLLLAVLFALAANGDFSLRLNINGDDLSELEILVIDPERELTIDLHIYDVNSDITLDRILVTLMFAGQPIRTLSQSLGNRHIAAEEDYREKITLNTREVLKLGDMTLVTGIYPAIIKLEYTISDQKKDWNELKNVKILDNPMSTPLGAAGVVTSVGAFAAILILLRSLISPGIPIGTTMPANTPFNLMQRLYDFVKKRLEPTTRGRVMGNITRAAKGRIMKKRCPICRTHLRYGYCYTCKKSAKEVRKEYIDKVKALVIQSSELFASGEVVALDELNSKLGIDATLGTDVIAILKHAKFVKVRGIVSNLAGKLIMVGFSSGLSAVIWITVGGFAVLSTSVLIAILVASVVIPIAVAKSFQIRARRAFKNT